MKPIKPTKLNKDDVDKIQDKTFDAVQWLNRHINSFDGEYPDRNVIDFFEKNDFIYKGTAYRGNLKEEKKEEMSSWSKSERVAADFACREDGYFNTAKVSGLDIKKSVNEISKWSPDIAKFMYEKRIDNIANRESEVLVLSKKDISNKKRQKYLGYCKI